MGKARGKGKRGVTHRRGSGLLLQDSRPKKQLCERRLDQLWYCLGMFRSWWTESFGRRRTAVEGEVQIQAFHIDRFVVGQVPFLDLGRSCEGKGEESEHGGELHLGGVSAK